MSTRGSSDRPPARPPAAAAASGVARSQRRQSGLGLGLSLSLSLSLSRGPRLRLSLRLGPPLPPQPVTTRYAFTTKSLYVGHMDYKYLRWQVIDTPGVLDRPIEESATHLQPSP